VAAAGERPTSARAGRDGRAEQPTRIGPYSVQRPLETSSTGVVHLCRADDGRLVALKTVAAEFARDRAFLAQLRAEVLRARDAAPGCLAEILDVDVDGPTPYVVAEYLDAPSLGAMVDAGGPLSAAGVGRLGAALATGLAELHHADLILGDLKPGRVVLAAGGPRFVDFGLARARGRLGAGARRGQAVATFGAPAFMAPELALGNPLTAAADVFACASLIVYAAVGRPPFGAGSPRALLQRVVYTEPNLTGVPAPLVAVIADAMRKDPARRIRSRDLADRLLEIAHLPSPATASTTWAGAADPRRPASAGLEDLYGEVAQAPYARPEIILAPPPGTTARNAAAPEAPAAAAVASANGTSPAVAAATAEPGVAATAEPGVAATAEPGVAAAGGAGVAATAEPDVAATAEPGVAAAGGASAANDATMFIAVPGVEVADNLPAFVPELVPPHGVEPAAESRPQPATEAGDASAGDAPVGDSEAGVREAGAVATPEPEPTSDLAPEPESAPEPTSASEFVSEPESQPESASAAASAPESDSASVPVSASVLVSESDSGSKSDSDWEPPDGPPAGGGGAAGGGDGGQGGGDGAGPGPGAGRKPADERASPPAPPTWGGLRRRWRSVVTRRLLSFATPVSVLGGVVLVAALGVSGVVTLDREHASRGAATSRRLAAQAGGVQAGYGGVGQAARPPR